MDLKIIDDTYTAKEVEAKLRISNTTLNRWRKAGRIQFVEYPMRTYRYVKTDVERIAEGGL